MRSASAIRRPVLDVVARIEKHFSACTWQAQGTHIDDRLTASEAGGSFSSTMLCPHERDLVPELETFGAVGPGGLGEDYRGCNM